VRDENDLRETIAQTAQQREHVLAPGFVAVPLSAGEHRLHIAYRPPRWKTLLAILGPLALLVLAATERRAVAVLDRALTPADARLAAWTRLRHNH